MKIGIDARLFGARQRGIGRYVQCLIEGLEKSDTRNEYVVFLRRENWHEYEPQNPHFKKTLADCRWYSVKEQALMPIKIWRARVDLMHFPHFNIPFFCPVKFVVTLHDMILQRFPTPRASMLAPIIYWIKNFAYRVVIWAAVKRARKIIAITNHTKQDILRYFRVEPNKIVVIYEGVSVEAGRRKTENPKFKAWRPYLLYVGGAYPHKNLEGLLTAFRRFAKREAGINLVLAGGEDFFYQRLRRSVLAFEKSVSDRIIFAGFVPESELFELFARAELFVFPSKYEGFGLPPLEAMACGVPVASSSASCLPEVLGDAALYFDPADVNDMAEKIRYGLGNRVLRADLIAKGCERIKRYSWAKMARETKGIYEACE